MQNTIEQYLSSVDAKESTRAIYRKALESFAHWVDDCDVVFFELTTKDIIAYKDSLLKSGRSAMTVNLYLSTVRGFYRWAAAEGICDNVAQNVGSVRTKKETFRRMHLENDEGAKLITESYLPKEYSAVNDGVLQKLRAIGLDGHEYSAHSLRHTTGTQILKNGGTMMDVQQVLRHATPSTSQIYVNTIMEEKRLDDASEQILDNSFKIDDNDNSNTDQRQQGR